MPNVGDVMVQTFQMAPLDQVESSMAEALSSPQSDFLVVTGERNAPLSLLATSQDRSRLTEGEMVSLPVAPVIREDVDLEDAARALVLILLDRRDLEGAVVFQDGEVRGILPRQLIVQVAGPLLTNLGFQLPGNPFVPVPIYECPHGGHYQEPVFFYDRHNPPKCPTHHVLLVRKD